MSVKLITPVFRVSYPHIWEPGTDMQGNQYYGLAMIFNKAPLPPEGQRLIHLPAVDVTPIKEAIRKAIAEKWGQDQAKWPRNLKICLRDADQEDRSNPNLDNYDPAYVSTFFMNGKSGRPIPVVDENVNPLMDQARLYSGCYARASVNFAAYDKGGGKGCGCYINSIMLVGDGEPIGGGAPPAVDFAEFKTASSTSGFD